MSEADPEDRLRILWLVKGLSVGGTELLLCWLAAIRDTKRFDHRVAYLLASHSTLVPDLEQLGVPVDCLCVKAEWRLEWAWRLRRLLIREKIDVVHCQSPYAAVVARLVVRSLGIARRPAVLSTEHSIWPDYVVPTRLLNALTYPLEQAHLAVSDAVRRSIPRPWRRNVEVVRHGFPLDRVRLRADVRAEVRAELGIDDNVVIVGTVANFRAEKGYPDLLAAAARVLSERDEVRFIAVGHGPLEAAIKDLHTALGLGDRFAFLGYRADALRVLAGCDVFVLASLHEGYPIVVMEALAVGLPVVVTDVGAVREVVSPGAEGLIVPPGDSVRLAHALQRVVDDAGLRADMARAASRHIGEFDISEAAQRLEQLYQKLARDRRRATPS